LACWLSTYTRRLRSSLAASALAVGAVEFVFGFLLVAVSPVCCDDGEPNFGLSTTTGGTGFSTGLDSDFGELNLGFSTTAGGVGLDSDFGELNLGFSAGFTTGSSFGLAVLGDPNFGLEPMLGLLEEGGLLLELPVAGGFDELLGGLELLEGGLEELDDGGLLDEPLLELEGGLLEPPVFDCPNPSWTNKLAAKTARTTGTSSFHVFIAEFLSCESQIYNTRPMVSRSHFVESKHSKISHAHFKSPSGVLECL